MLKSLKMKFLTIPVGNQSHNQSSFQASSLDYSKQSIVDTFQTVSNLLNDTKYYWKIRAQNAAGYGDWSSVSSFTTIVSYPSLAKLVYPSNGATDLPIDINFIWKKAANASSYDLQISKTDDFSNPEFIFENIADTLKTVGSLKNKTEYYWRVRGQNVAGYGDWSLTSSFTTIISNTSAAEPSRLGWQPSI